MTRGVASALSAPDKLALGFIAAVAGVSGLAGAATARDLLLLAAQAGAIALVASWGRRSRVGNHVHAFFPVVVVFGLFETIGPIIHELNPARFDAALAALDARWFGTLAERWRGVLGRPDWLTDLASVSYLSFYALPVAVAAALYPRRARSNDFDLFATSILATFLASYVGYFLWPALGPRVPSELESTLLGGGPISSAVRAFLHVVERNQLDAFPSGHAAVAVATLRHGWRALPRGRIALVLVVAGILFATVYLSLHYVIDIAAGLALGMLVPALVVGRQRHAADVAA